MLPLPAAASPVSLLMAEKSLVNEVAVTVGTAVGLCEELVEVAVFFEQAVSTTARARVSARRECGRWSFMNAGPLCLLLGCSMATGASSVEARTYGARGRPPYPRRGCNSRGIIPVYFHYISLPLQLLALIAAAPPLRPFFARNIARYVTSRRKKPKM